MAKSDAPNYRESDSDSKCSNCLFDQSGFCSLYEFDYDLGYTCDSWAAMESVKVAKPHGFLIWTGKQTAIANDVPFSANKQLTLISGNEAFGRVILDDPKHVSLSEFDRLAYKGDKNHCTYEKEREQLWPTSETLVIQDIKEFIPFVEFESKEDSIGKSASLIIEETNEGIKFSPVDEEEQAFVKMFDTFPRHIILNNDGVLLRKNIINAVEGFDKNKLRKGMLDAIPDDKELPLYSIGLIKNYSLRFRNKKETSFDRGDKMDEKEASFDAIAHAVKEAFWKHWYTVNNDYSRDVWPIEVFEDWLVIEENGVLKRIDYSFDDDHYVFVDETEWTVVERTYMEKEKGSILDRIKSTVSRFTKILNGNKQVDPFEFEVFGIKEVNGKPWYLTKSTNAFIDRDKEIFSTKALEDFVDRVMEKEDKGYHNFWHIPGTDFAKKEWCGVIGKFLIEAGPFLDDEAGQAALKFFTEYPEGHPDIAPEGWGCSPEFRFLPEDREDSIYDWLHITRTSTLPLASAANVYTEGGTTMALKDSQREAAIKIFGEDFMSNLESDLEKETATLEDSGLESKEKTEEIKEEKVEEVEEEKTPAEINIPLDELATQLSKQISLDINPIIEGVSQLKVELDELKSTVSTMEEKQEVKTKAEQPRYVFNLTRAVDSEKTLVTEDDKIEDTSKLTKPNQGNLAASYFGDK